MILGVEKPEHLIYHPVLGHPLYMTGRDRYMMECNSNRISKYTRPRQPAIYRDSLQPYLEASYVTRTTISDSSSSMSISKSTDDKLRHAVEVSRRSRVIWRCSQLRSPIIELCSSSKTIL